ncbi:transmembrane protein 184C isoform X2 [Fukomys damarensis]|uniref:transmembrane protein 184C isoform X2 n=1 Tax=Fukomys damarensis TaxID=885580 RepID=UPI0005403681|nr:transmembrane protein 184C isoform X2 [Fukomys damarensis]
MWKADMCCAASENNWKQWIISLIIALYVVSIMVAAILFIWQSEEDQVGIYTKAWTLASIFVVTAVVISLRRILQHAMHYTQPELQQAIIRILWMVPIYSVNSWLALIKPSAAIYLNTFRDGYEAYIIYNFMIFLNNYLTSQYRDVTAVLESKEQQKHIPPLCCFPPWEMGKVLLFGCKLGVLQYIPVRIVTTVVAVICKSLHVYHEGTFNLKDSCIYLVIISSSSQGVAMYCLTLFYVTFKKEFKPVNAIGKLLSMKLFILVSFL